jgi:hypothetical protein
VDRSAEGAGAKASTKRFVPASPPCGLGPRIATTSVRTPMPKSGCSSNGRRTKPRRPNTGSRPWRRIQPSRPSSKLPNCAGGSGATIRNSSRNWASITMKVEAGEAFTTTWRSASQPMDSWSFERRSDSPLRRQSPRHQNVSPIQRFSTPRIPRSEQNAKSNRQSQASALGWPEVSPGHCPDAPVAKEPTYDTVRIRWVSQRGDSFR